MQGDPSLAEVPEKNSQIHRWIDRSKEIHKDLLVKTVDECTQREVVSAMKSGAPGFDELQKFYFELKAMYKFHTGSKPNMTI